MVEIITSSTVQDSIQRVMDHVRAEIPGIKIRIVFPDRRKIEPSTIDESWKIRAKNVGLKIS